MKKGNNHRISSSELTVLKYLGEGTPSAAELQTTEIAQISVSTGLRDSDEVLRALYTLEGKNLVAPEPLGDFTSNRWQITDVGRKALQIICN